MADLGFRSLRSLALQALIFVAVGDRKSSCVPENQGEPRPREFFTTEGTENTEERILCVLCVLSVEMFSARPKEIFNAEIAEVLKYERPRGECA